MLEQKLDLAMKLEAEIKLKERAIIDTEQKILSKIEEMIQRTRENGNKTLEQKHYKTVS